MSKWCSNLTCILMLLMVGCVSNNEKRVSTQNYYSSVIEGRATEACLIIAEDLDRFEEDLEVLQRISSKPLDQDIYKAIEDARNAAKSEDYHKLVEAYWFATRLLQGSVGDGDIIEVCRRSLDEIENRLKGNSTCEEAYADVMVLRTKRILQRIIIPEVSFAPPDTLIDAVDFFKKASRDYDLDDSPVEQRGVSLVLKIDCSDPEIVDGEIDDPFAVTGDNGGGSDVPVIPSFHARHISMYDALNMVCDLTGYKLNLRRGLVMIVPLEEECSDDDSGVFEEGARKGRCTKCKKVVVCAEVWEHGVDEGGAPVWNHFYQGKCSSCGAKLFLDDTE